MDICLSKNSEEIAAILVIFQVTKIFKEEVILKLSLEMYKWTFTRQMVLVGHFMKQEQFEQKCGGMMTLEN